MTTENKKPIDVSVDGKELKLAVLRPNYQVQQKAQQVHNKAFREAVEKGAILRARIEAVMREQKLWDDAKQARFDEANSRLLTNERKLAKGGIKLNEARDLAIQMRRDRLEIRFLLSDRNQLDQNTAEAQAENARFNFMVSACTVNAESGKGYYKDYEDYQGRENDPVAPAAANALGKMIYNLDDDFDKKLPENKFLLKYSFCNDKLHLIDVKGRLVDTAGRLVDDQGRLINEAGELVDIDGNLLTADGEYKVDFVPFTDEDGKPVDVPEPEAQDDKNAA